LQKKSTLYIQRGADGYAKREELKVPESDMFRAELEMLAESCRTGKSNELSAHNGNVAVAMVYAALKSIEQNGQRKAISEVLEGRPEPRSGLTGGRCVDLTQPEIAAQLKKNPLVICRREAWSSTARICRSWSDRDG
jgi:hypothetical protein